MTLHLSIRVVVVVVRQLAVGGNRGYIHEFVDGIEYYFTDNDFETAGKTATNTQGGEAGIVL